MNADWFLLSDGTDNQPVTLVRRDKPVMIIVYPRYSLAASHPCTPCPKTDICSMRKQVKMSTCLREGFCCYNLFPIVGMSRFDRIMMMMTTARRNQGAVMLTAIPFLMLLNRVSRRCGCGMFGFQAIQNWPASVAQFKAWVEQSLPKFTKVGNRRQMECLKRMKSPKLTVVHGYDRLPQSCPSISGHWASHESWPLLNVGWRSVARVVHDFSR